MISDYLVQQPTRRTVDAPSVYAVPAVGHVVFDFRMLQVVLRDNGRLEFCSLGPDKFSTVRIANLKIIDQRSDKTLPALTIRNGMNVLIESVAFACGRDGVALELTQCWDTKLSYVSIQAPRIGLKITNNCNWIDCRSVTIQKAYEESILAEDSRNLFFDSHCKLHGFGTREQEHLTPRVMVRYRNCGSVRYHAAMMHCMPDPDFGLIDIVGQKSENMLIEPLVMRCGVGEITRMRDVPASIQSRTSGTVEWRQPSLVR
jgi:hypothetical protein